MKRKYTYEEALHRMAALCSMSERCVGDVLEKLLDWGLEKNDAEKIIEYLQREKYIDESRFCAAFVKDKFRFSKWGRVKIAYALRQKGVSEDCAAEALRLIDDEESERTLFDLLRGKQRVVKAATEYEKRCKLAKFAQSRGFEPDLIFRVLKRI